MTIHLKKPLAFFDLETTGTNITQDRVVEISVLKVNVANEVTIKTTRINPTIPIPLESSLIHGIYDEDVANMPTFKNIAHSLAQFLEGCDLGGFNLIKFDVPVLVEEFLRAGIEFDVNTRKIVDVQRIFHLMEPRTLGAALKFYCNKELEDAHNAEADTIATYEVFKAQLERYKDVVIKDKNGKEFIPVQNDINALHNLTAMQFADLAGRIAYNSKGEEVFNFGKYKDQLVAVVLEKDPSYYDWIMKGDFALNTKRKVTEIKLRKFNLR